VSQGHGRTLDLSLTAPALQLLGELDDLGGSGGARVDFSSAERGGVQLPGLMVPPGMREAGSHAYRALETELACLAPEPIG